MSEREGIPPDQWCYEPNAEGRYAAGMKIRPNHIALTGYRLPLEVEWDCATRAGTSTTRPFGRSSTLVSRYAWFIVNARGRVRESGLLRPNEWGLFDCLGNVAEWCADPAFVHASAQVAGVQFNRHLTVTGNIPRNLRGGNVSDSEWHLRSAARAPEAVAALNGRNGFRVARTIRD